MFAHAIANFVTNRGVSAPDCIVDGIFKANSTVSIARPVKPRKHE